MNNSTPRIEHCRPDSRGDITIIVDGPGDTTVRPIPPEQRAQAIAQLEKIRYWEQIERENRKTDQS